MEQKHGTNERPHKMLERLSENDVVDVLIQKGVIKTEADMEIGVMGWALVLSLDRRDAPYTAGLVSEEQALKTVETARRMALKNFNSWDEFGRSQVIGMALDYYRHDDTFFIDYIETYKSVLTDHKSPWNKIEWKG